MWPEAVNPKPKTLCELGRWETWPLRFECDSVAVSLGDGTPGVGI